MIWFTSDTHFGHTNIIKYCERPFTDADTMDDALIRNWNHKVAHTDIVYHLGDFAFGNGKFWKARRSALSGSIRLIRGNHDHQIPSGLFEWVKDYKEVEHEGLKLVLFHYPMRSWHHNMRGVGHLYGHCHGGIPDLGKSFDVGVDRWGFAPLSLDEVKALLDAREAKWSETGFINYSPSKSPL